MKAQTSVEYIILLAVGIVITLFIVVLLFNSSETKDYTLLEDLQALGGSVSIVGYDITDYGTTVEIKNIERSVIRLTDLRINAIDCFDIDPTFIGAGDTLKVNCPNVVGTSGEDERFTLLMNWTVVDTGAQQSTSNLDITLSDSVGSRYLAILDNEATYSFANNGCWDTSGSQPWPLCTCYDVNLTRQSSTTRVANYSIRNNIDFQRCMDVFGDAGWTTGSGWLPIGECTGSCGAGGDDIPFNGSIDGNNFIISGLYINRPTTNFVGLFAYLEDEAGVFDLKLSNVDVIGQSNVGAVVGYANGGVPADPDILVENISVEGVVNGTSATGGLFGYLSQGSAVALTFSGTVYSGSQVGGLIGDARDVNIRDSWAEAYVNGSSVAGGLVSQGYYSRIDNSYFRGVVSATNSVGGISGQGLVTTNSSYVVGSVNGASDVGGIQGYANYGDILNSYMVGDVSGSSNVGGFVGYSFSGSITNSYADGRLTCSSTCGGLVGSSSSDTFSNATWTNYTGDNSTGCVGGGGGDSGSAAPGCTP